MDQVPQMIHDSLNQLSQQTPPTIVSPSDLSGSWRRVAVFDKILLSRLVAVAVSVTFPVSKVFTAWTLVKKEEQKRQFQGLEKNS